MRNCQKVGLERFLRLVQSICLILTSCPSLLPCALPLASDATRTTARAGMLGLTAPLNLTRRTVRLFWCLDSFQAGWAAATTTNKDSNNAASSSSSSLETWLGVMSTTLFGVFGLMESLTLPDLLRVQHVRVFGHEAAQELDEQAQGLWLAALVCAILGTALKMVRILPPRAAAAATPHASATVARDDSETRGEDGGGGEEEARQGRNSQEIEKVAAAAAKTRDDDAVERRSREEARRQLARLTRNLAADVLDLAIPASAMGLVNVAPGVLAVGIFCSTLLTGHVVWERCGQAIDRKSA